MFISNSEIIIGNDTKAKKIVFDNFEVYFKGIIFVSGRKAGHESIERIIDFFIGNKRIDFPSIFGNYFVLIIDKRDSKKYFFTDNSGIFKSYIYKDSIFTSFLEIVDYHKEIGLNDLNYSSVVEFLHFGFTYFENTLIESVKRVSGDVYYTFENDKIEKKSKGLTPISNSPKVDINKFFSDFVYAVSDKRISLDLTGGFDSRLILSYFIKNNADFELALSGIPGNSDITIASKISGIIQKSFYPTIHSIVGTGEDDLASIFDITDSQIDILDYHRNNQLNKDRLSRGVDLHISGVGGELYKDFWWLQDFPFYNSKKINIEKLYDLRIESSSFPNYILGESVKSISTETRKSNLAKLKEYVLDSNTKTYDNIYYNYKMKTNAGVYISVANNYFISYAPLLEFELVKVGFNLPRCLRFYNNFHRKVITANNPKLAKTRTTEGISSSSNWAIKFLDLFYYAIDKTKRLLKQILRKVFNKTYLQETPTNSDIYNIIRSNQFLEKSIQYLKEIKVLDKNVSADIIPNFLIGRILTLGFLLQRIKKV